MANRRQAKKNAAAAVNKEAAKKEVKTTVAEETAEKVTAVEKVAEKAAEVKEAVKDKQKEIKKKVKENWTKVQKNKIKDIKTIKVFLQPENSCAYYTINDEGNDSYKIEL